MDGDSSSIYLSAIIILLLLFFAAYFAVCETAFASVSRIRLKLEADRGDRRAKRALFVTEHFDKAITTILIGTNIVHLAAARCTILVPMRMVVMALSKCSVTKSARLARRSPRSASSFSRMRLTEAKAVSHTAKYAAKNSNNRMIMADKYILLLSPSIGEDHTPKAKMILIKQRARPWASSVSHIPIRSRG